ncbi:iron-containing alcohol dehydrogenase [Vibrio maritimus]
MLHYKAVIAISKQINKLINIPFPDVHQGFGAVDSVGQILAKKGMKKPLIVTDKTLVSLGIADKVIASLNESGLECAVFDGVEPDPCVESVELGFKIYQDNHCDCIIALGGGSPMDCAKIIGAKVVRNIDVRKMAGQLKIRKKLPHLIAIPTTAGTGSEATLAAVISDKENNAKFAVIDPSLVPKDAILDPALMAALPAPITAATGMDALTHAIEAYLGGYSTTLTDKYAEDAIKSIFKNLPLAYTDGENMVAREWMAVASYQAGCSFTRAFVGYVHAIAHQLGALYHVPHGLANAVLLPHILRFNLSACEQKFESMAKMIGLNTGLEFIEAVEQMNETLNIPQTINKLKIEDFDEISKRALKEAHGTYPVPRYMTQVECETILFKLLPN